jgi:6-pyruvoyltetrahydropterin/6-carboxytetrahydropterin synthase
MSWDLIVKERFSAAHFLEHYQGKCERMHGHTFEVEVVIAAGELDASGIAIDFCVLRDYLKEILPDHKVLNEVYPFSPSAENLARELYQTIRQRFPVKHVTVWESPTAGARYAEG